MHRGAGRNTYDGKIAGLYDLEATLGRGHFAVVKSARHVFTGEKVAVKVIDKSKLDEVSRAHLFQEVRCMKLVQHPNVVRLYEVIDTATKLYLILELGDGGDLYDYIMRHETGLGEDMAREYFRQIVRAISYCHRLHVAHRDLKPENVVFFERLGMVKLTDFGFSNRFNPGQKLETSCGSLAYSAPEILLGDSYDAPAVDVWSLGVILYMLVCGQAPFQEANDSETLTMIMDVKYTIPVHVSAGCKRLIARMLLREPDKRASLEEIAGDPWLNEDVGSSAVEPADFLPLVSREHVSEEDHALIIQKMSNGNIATKEEILEALDKNEYNHITATYFLLAERKLRAHRQEQATNQQRLRQILPSPLATSKPFLAIDITSPQENDSASSLNPSLLLTPASALSRAGAGGDVAHRARKCSIVQEEEDEDDDISGAVGREDLAPPRSSLNRRGSRSEGKLNIAVQERIGEAERRKEAGDIVVRDDSSRVKVNTPIWTKRNSPTIDTRPSTAPVIKSTPPNQLSIPNTTSITESSTITIPLKPSAALPVAALLPKYKTMPSPTRLLGSPQLNEIFEEGDGPVSGGGDAVRQQGRGFGARTAAYEQRRTKFHKARTASCSSSDASDDDSESRKKRAHKLTAEGKPLPQRRDSHDDSSDSQDPSGSGGGAGGGGGGARAERTTNQPTDVTASNTRQTSSSGSGGGGREARQCSSSGATCATGAAPPFSRRHRAGGRRRAGETRLRESQSLNRITEVQEAEHSVAAATPVVAPQASRPRSLGARLLQGWSLTSMNKKSFTESEPKPSIPTHFEEKENCKLPKSEKKSGKKVRLLSRYFQMHKKLCLPLPGLFGRGRLYKAQSCGSIVRDRVCQQPGVATVAVVANGVCNGDINQNVGLVRSTPRLDTIVPLVSNCPGVAICSVHLGDVTKCCHLC